MAEIGSNAQAALNYCLRKINTRLRSTHELKQALESRGTEADVISSVMTELQEIGLLDDTQYARAWVHTRDRLAPRGATLLRMELLQKGIAKEIIGLVLAERANEAADDEAEQPSEEQLARDLLDGKMRQYAHLDSVTRTRRLTALLMRRGFSYEVARRILNT